MARAGRRGRANGSSRISSASTTRLTCVSAISFSSSGWPSSSRRAISFLRSWRSIRRRSTGDLSGTPYLDEDYLILSTVHSAKGQEWDAVYILNVADGNFPSEFSTGRSDQIEEERRLLYVAMTRAKTDLHLIAPLKYYVANQPKNGDRHVYGARSRFLTKAVMAKLDAITSPEDGDQRSATASNTARVNVAGKLRSMW